MGCGASASPAPAQTPPAAISPEDLKQIINAFEAADLDQSGELSYDEFTKLMTGFESPKFSKEQVDAMIKAVDADNSGQIDRAEFLAWCMYGDERIFAALKEVRKMQYDHQPGAFAHVAAQVPCNEDPSDPQVKKKCVNCDFAVTGITPDHCCMACKREAGRHGPRCQKIQATPSSAHSKPGEDADSEPDSRGAEVHGSQEADADLSSAVFDFLTDEHLAFFHKYGFVVVRGLHNKHHVEKAMEGAQKLLDKEERAKDGGKGEQAFGSLPEGSRSTWGRCTLPELEGFFKFKKNNELMKHFIGNFQFKHHDGPGFFTFAPRFHRWSTEPTDTPSSQSFTVHPFNLKKLPHTLSPFAKEFIEKAAKLGIRVAPSQDHNWHLDGEDYNSSMVFNILWGSFINGLPKGGMGNLQVYPGSHHYLAKVMRTKGAFWVWDGKMERQTKDKPDLTCPGISEDIPYALCVKAGDIVLAHPWLAHGIGCNTSNQHRLAVYCRLSSNNFWWPPDSCERMKVAGRSLGQTPWTEPGKTVKWKGNPWAGLPGMNKWIKNSQDKIDAYDGGSLSRAMTSL